MNDEQLEQRIRATLRREAPWEVPVALELRAARIPLTEPAPAPSLPRRLHLAARRGVLSLAAAAAVIVSLVVLTLSFRTGPAPAASWQPIEVSGLTGGTVFQVVSGPAGLIAVGVDDPSAPEQHPRIWTSPDGRSWQAVHDLDSYAAPPNTFAMAAAPWKQGWVVVSEGIVLTSADGTNWRAWDLSGTAWGVAVDGDRIVAVGYRPGQGSAWWTPAAWTYTDATQWVTATTFAGGAEFGNLWGVTRVRGGFLAYGFVHEDGTIATDAPSDSPEFRSAGIPWFSADGVTWHRVIVPSETGPFAGTWVTQVVAGGPGFVAIGHDVATPSTPRLWTSADGATWTRVAGPLPFDSIRDAALALGGDGHRVMSFAVPMARRESQLWNQETAPPGDRTIAWTSSDGLAWQAVASSDALAGVRLIDVVPFGSGMLALGNREAPAAACPTPSASGGAAATPASEIARCNAVSAWIIP